jgi:DNA-binding MarR family transcriptional regulator
MSADPFAKALRRWIRVSMLRSMREVIRHARQSGLSMSHLGTLFYLNRTEKCGVTDVGDHLGVTGGAASQMIDRLVGQGLVLRTIDPNDRRAKRIELTAQGKRVLRDGLRTRAKWVDELEKSLSNEDKAMITQALDVLSDRMEAMAEPSEPVGKQQPERMVEDA